MENRQLISVRSNCDFSLDYEKGTLHPHTEVIIITQSPNYKVNEKTDKISRGIKVDEFRFKSSLDGINKLIGELQIVAQNMIKFEQLSGSFNAFIKSAQDKQNDK